MVGGQLWKVEYAPKTYNPIGNVRTMSVIGYKTVYHTWQIDDGRPKITSGKSIGIFNWSL